MEILEYSYPIHGWTNHDSSMGNEVLFKIQVEKYNSDLKHGYYRLACRRPDKSQFFEGYQPVEQLNKKSNQGHYQFQAVCIESRHPWLVIGGKSGRLKIYRILRTVDSALYELDLPEISGDITKVHFLEDNNSFIIGTHIGEVYMITIQSLKSPEINPTSTLEYQRLNDRNNKISITSLNSQQSGDHLYIFVGDMNGHLSFCILNSCQPNNIVEKENKIDLQDTIKNFALCTLIHQGGKIFSISVYFETTLLYVVTSGYNRNFIIILDSSNLGKSYKVYNIGSKSHAGYFSAILNQDLHSLDTADNKSLDISIASHISKYEFDAPSNRLDSQPIGVPSNPPQYKDATLRGSSRLASERSGSAISNFLSHPDINFEPTLTHCNNFYKKGSSEYTTVDTPSFTPHNLNNDDILIYASRPGGRLWVSNSKGVVQKTIRFMLTDKQPASLNQLIFLNDTYFLSFLPHQLNQSIYIYSIKNALCVLEVRLKKILIDISFDPYTQQIFLLYENPLELQEFIDCKFLGNTYRIKLSDSYSNSLGIIKLFQSKNELFHCLISSLTNSLNEINEFPLVSKNEYHHDSLSWLFDSIALDVHTIDYSLNKYKDFGKSFSSDMECYMTLDYFLASDYSNLSHTPHFSNSFDDKKSWESFSLTYTPKGHRKTLSSSTKKSDLLIRKDSFFIYIFLGILTYICSPDFLLDISFSNIEITKKLEVTPINNIDGYTQLLQNAYNVLKPFNVALYGIIDDLLRIDPNDLGTTLLTYVDRISQWENEIYSNTIETLTELPFKHFPHNYSTTSPTLIHQVLEPHLQLSYYFEDCKIPHQTQHNFSYLKCTPSNLTSDIDKTTLNQIRQPTKNMPNTPQKDAQGCFESNTKIEHTFHQKKEPEIELNDYLLYSSSIFQNLFDSTHSFIYITHTSWLKSFCFHFSKIKSYFNSAVDASGYQYNYNSYHKSYPIEENLPGINFKWSGYNQNDTYSKKFVHISDVKQRSIVTRVISSTLLFEHLILLTNFKRNQSSLHHLLDWNYLFDLYHPRESIFCEVNISGIFEYLSEVFASHYKSRYIENNTRLNLNSLAHLGYYIDTQSPLNDVSVISPTRLGHQSTIYKPSVTRLPETRDIEGNFDTPDFQNNLKLYTIPFNKQFTPQKDAEPDCYPLSKEPTDATPSKPTSLGYNKPTTHSFVTHEETELNVLRSHKTLVMISDYLKFSWTEKNALEFCHQFYTFSDIAFLQHSEHKQLIYSQISKIFLLANLKHWARVCGYLESYLEALFPSILIPIKIPHSFPMDFNIDDIIPLHMWFRKYLLICEESGDDEEIKLPQKEYDHMVHYFFPFILPHNISTWLKAPSTVQKSNSFKKKFKISIGQIGLSSMFYEERDKHIFITFKSLLLFNNYIFGLINYCTSQNKFIYTHLSDCTTFLGYLNSLIYQPTQLRSLDITFYTHRSNLTSTYVFKNEILSRIVKYNYLENRPNPLNQSIPFHKYIESIFYKSSNLTSIDCNCPKTREQLYNISTSLNTPISHISNYILVFSQQLSFHRKISDSFGFFQTFDLLIKFISKLPLDRFPSINNKLTPLPMEETHLTEFRDRPLELLLWQSIIFLSQSISSSNSHSELISNLSQKFHMITNFNGHQDENKFLTATFSIYTYRPNEKISNLHTLTQAPSNLSTKTPIISLIDLCDIDYLPAWCMDVLESFELACQLAYNLNNSNIKNSLKREDHIWDTIFLLILSSLRFEIRQNTSARDFQAKIVDTLTNKSYQNETSPNLFEDYSVYKLLPLTISFHLIRRTLLRFEESMPPPGLEMLIRCSLQNWISLKNLAPSTTHIMQTATEDVMKLKLKDVTKELDLLEIRKHLKLYVYKEFSKCY